MNEQPQKIVYALNKEHTQHQNFKYQSGTIAQTSKKIIKMKIRNRVEHEIMKLRKEAFNKQEQIRDLASRTDIFDAPEIAKLCNIANLIWNQIAILEELGGKYRKEKI